CALERELVVLPRRAVDVAQQDLRFELDELVGPAIRDAEHEPGEAAIWCDNGARAEYHSCRRPREAREENAGAEREAQQADERLDRHHEMRRHAVRRNVAVADGGERLDAEEESAPESAADGRRRDARERIRATCEIGKRE